MRIGMRLLLGFFYWWRWRPGSYWLFLSKKLTGRAKSNGGDVDRHRNVAGGLARPDLLSGDPTHGQLAQALISYNIARFAPISVALTKCA